MEKFNLTQTGQEVQEILDGAAKLSDVNTEKERAELAEEALGASIQQNAEDIDAIEAKIPSDATAENPLTDKEYVDGLVSDEATAREQADETLQGNIDAEETRAKAAEKQNADDIDAIEEKIPSDASSGNQLTTKNYVDNSVATASATFRGTYNLVSDLHLTVDASRSDIASALGNAIANADNNDYAFVQIPTSVDTPTEIGSIERYKFNGSAWTYEYTLNNSGYTAAQWAAINSGITSGLVAKLGSLPTASELETALLAKQDILTFDSAPTPGSLNPVTSAGIHTAIDTEKGARQNADAALQQAIEAILVLIPSAASALNQLADKAFVNSSIATNTATFRGTFNLVSDLHLALNASHTDVANALANAISSANNNDYCFVQIPTSVDTPTEIRVTERYKFNGTAWAYEYDLNNSGFTVAQWEAINSAITSALVTKLSALPTAAELAASLDGKQAVLTFDNQPEQGSSNPVKSGGVYDVVAAINAKIPSDADPANKLVTEARIATIIGALDADFDLTSADEHITFKMTQRDGQITSVQILTYDIASALALTTLGGRVSINEGDISNLRAAYAALTQSDIVIVNGALPSSGQQQNIIYRQPDPNHNPPQFYSDFMWNGTTWVLMAQYNNAIDPRPKKGSQNLVTSGGVFDIMGALDVSELNATDNPHTLVTYADLSAALAAIPSDYQKGGMSIKFVQTSDNKYVQCRLIADEFTTDTTQWAIADEGVYVENPEFVYVKTDREGKILWAIKIDGGIYYGAGVPPQIIDYINEKIAELSLDEYEDIVAFLADLEKGDKTLQNLLDEKVDKEEGKSLINADYASTKSTGDNPEFLDVTLDAEDKVLEGVQKDGTKVIGGDLNVGGSASISGGIRVLGNMEVSGVSYKVIENPEYLAAWVDAEDKVIFGLKTDGKTYVGDADFLNDIKGNQEAIAEIKTTLATIGVKVDSLDIDALSSIAAIENPEYIEAKTDLEGKLLAGRTPDGAAFEKVGFSTPKASIDGHIIESIEDPEGRSEITTDTEGKIISYRDSEGVKHEEVGIETDSATVNHLNLTESGMTEFQQALKDAGFQPGGAGDWSDKEYVNIPIPRVCAMINFGLDSQATSKSDRPDYIPGVNGDIPTFIEFYDMNGNYFKKPILLSAQGSSSMGYYIKNQAFDLDDGSTIKFGEWVAQDSFHVKKYYIDNFRGQCIVGYWLTEQVYKTYPYGERRPWDYLNIHNDSFNGLGKIDRDFETGALAHPDGFPVMVYFNGKCNGLYTLNLKKHRDNYYQNKKNTGHIILDGALGTDQIFGNISTYGNIMWDAFEIRNPKPKKKKDGWEMTDIDGNAYNGDFPKELIGEDSPNYDSSNQSHVKTAEVKNNIIRLSKALKDLGPDATKEQYEQYFNAKFVIDYYLISNVLYHFDGFVKNWIWCVWDGNIWTPTIYDMDSIFGMHWQGGYIVNEGLYLGAFSGEPTYYMGKNRLYWTDVKARYAYLRQKGIFSVENIVNLMEKWVNWCEYDNIKNDLEIYAPETPSYRKNLVNSEYWEFVAHYGRVGSKPEYDPTKTDYASGDLVQYYNYVYRAKSAMPAGIYPSELYNNYPQVSGFYNSIQRVKNWLENRIIVLDSYFEYSNN